MKRSIQVKISGAAAAVCLSLGVAGAQADQPVVLTAPPSTGTLRTNFTGDAGFMFQVGSSNVSVDQLGYFDYQGDGLHANHSVGIWLLTPNLQSVLVAQGTVSSGTTDPLIDGYRFTSVNGGAVTLLAGQRYVLGADTAGDTVDQWYDGYQQNWNLTSGINPSPGTRYARYGSGSFPVFPGSNLGNGSDMGYGVADAMIATTANSSFTGASSGNFSDAGNWGGALPNFSAGNASLAIGGNRTSLNNDVSGASLAGLQFTSGASAITIGGNGFTLNGDISNYSANTQTLSTGQITFAGAAYINPANAPLVINSNVNLPSGVPLTFMGFNDATLNGQLTGSGNIAVDGTGTAFLEGNNSGFSGSLAINSGAISAANASALGSGAITVGLGELALNGNDTYSQPITINSKAVVQSGGVSQPAQLLSVGNNTISSTISLGGASNNEVIEADGGTLALTGQINALANNQTLYLQGSGNGIITGGNGFNAGSGTGSIIKTGTGTWTFDFDESELNNYVNGNIRVLEGTLLLDYQNYNNSKLSNPGFNGATLQLSGGTLEVLGNDSSNTAEAVLNAAGSAAGTTSVTSAGASYVVVTNGASATATLNLGTLTRTLGGTVDFSGTGTSQTITTNDATGILGGWATINGGASWAANDGNGNIVPFTNYVSDAWSASNNTDVTMSSAPAANSTTNTLRFNTAAANTVTLTGTNILNNSGILVTPNVGANTSTITGGALDTGSTVHDIIVQQYNTAAPLVIGSAIGPQVVSNGATTTSGSKSVTVASATGLYTGMPVVGTGIANGTTISSITGTTVTLSANATASGTPNLTFLSNDSITKSGPGTLTLNSPNTFAGVAYINDGQIVLNDPNALQNATVFLYANNGLNLNGLANVSIGNLGGYANLDLGSSNLTVSNSGGYINTSSYTYDGSISGSGSITLNGTGGSTWTAANPNWTGALVLNAGRVNVKNSQTLENVSGVTANASGASNTGAEVYLLSNMTTAVPFTIEGAGFTTSVGDAALRAGGDSIVTLTSPVTVDASGSITNTIIWIDDGSQLTLAGGVQAAASLPNQNLTLGATNTAQGLVSGNINIGTGTLTVSGLWKITSTSVTDGSTVINNTADLQIGDGGTSGSLGSGPVTETNNSTTQSYTRVLIFDRSDNITVPNIIGGSLGVWQIGSGTLNLTGTSAFTGAVQIQNGMVQASAAANLGGATSPVQFWSNSGTLQTTGSFTSTHPLTMFVSGTVDTAGNNASFGAVTGQAGMGLTKIGAGVLTVNSIGTATVPQSLAISAGTLAVAANGAASGASYLSSLAIAAGATMDLSNNGMLVDYTGTSPQAAIASEITAGFNKGNWNGTSATTGTITSSAAAAEANRASALGYIDTGSAVEVKYTWYGDLDLNGQVDSVDLNAFGVIPSTGPEAGLIGWFDGDLNYDGKINADDYSLFMLGDAEQNGSIIAGVPEPTALALIILPALLGSRRRRG